MVLTLFLSKKARTVTKTEVDLSRQEAGSERFSSTRLSRSLVRNSVGLSKVVSKLIPASVTQFIEKRFDFISYKKQFKNPEDVSSFDLLRGSVNMFVASSLIALGTSLKLPLSTTYVTFMVAIGTSLADRAWGRGERSIPDFRCGHDCRRMVLYCRHSLYDGIYDSSCH